jgi:hypothetical protein
MLATLGGFIDYENRFDFQMGASTLTPKVLRSQILAFALFGHVFMIRRCDMIFWEFYSR